MVFPTYKNEFEKLNEGFHFVAGCDEVGVGPLAGPVVASACIIDPACIGAYRSKSKWYYRVRDSKTINEKERESLVEEIKSHCLSFGIGEASVDEIDSLNIHHATLLAMQRAVMNMLIKFDEKDLHVYNSGEHVNNPMANVSKMFLFLDGRFTIKDLLVDKNSEHVNNFEGLVHKFLIKQRAVVDGDAKILSISAASIIAKVHRDAILKQFHNRFPGYGFEKHKGYNTKEHRNAIIKHGITEFHRKSFLKNLMSQKQVDAEII